MQKNTRSATLNIQLRYTFRIVSINRGLVSSIYLLALSTRKKTNKIYQKCFGTDSNGGIIQEANDPEALQLTTQAMKIRKWYHNDGVACTDTKYESG